MEGFAIRTAEHLFKFSTNVTQFEIITRRRNGIDTSCPIEYSKDAENGVSRDHREHRLE